MPIIMLKTNEIFLNQEQNIEHGICIAEHHMQFCCIAGALERPIVGVQNRGVRQQGLKGPATQCDAAHLQQGIPKTLRCLKIAWDAL